jgi:hypothetical protein
MFGPNSAIAQKLKWFKEIFGTNGKIATYLKDMKKAGIAKMFGPDSAIGRKLKWFKDVFGAEGKIATWLKDAKKATFAKWFGPESKFQGIIKTIKGWFGEGSFIGKVIKDLKSTTVFKTLFGKESALMKLTTWIGSFFGGGAGKGGLKGAFTAIAENPKFAKLRVFLKEL